eukprot:gnl/Chilomastix_cuspidata/3566.p1 GENE.gnl/Chilomastix_cuspidata/3566~~gnl/Chilomastix_cuspidata/3566.p1  ORF type:complete len:1159 (-),score=243.33 gnl/Chilomastix_cuspidata/3566:1441-4917(-)
MGCGASSADATREAGPVAPRPVRPPTPPLAPSISSYSNTSSESSTSSTTVVVAPEKDPTPRASRRVQDEASADTTQAHISAIRTYSRTQVAPPSDTTYEESSTDVCFDESGYQCDFFLTIVADSSTPKHYILPASAAHLSDFKLMMFFVSELGIDPSRLALVFCGAPISADKRTRTVSLARGQPFPRLIMGPDTAAAITCTLPFEAHEFPSMASLGHAPAEASGAERLGASVSATPKPITDSAAPVLNLDISLDLGIDEMTSFTSTSVQQASRSASRAQAAPQGMPKERVLAFRPWQEEFNDILSRAYIKLDAAEEILLSSAAAGSAVQVGSECRALLQEFREMAARAAQLVFGGDVEQINIAPIIPLFKSFDAFLVGGILILSSGTDADARKEFNHELVAQTAIMGAMSGAELREVACPLCCTVDISGVLFLALALPPANLLDTVVGSVDLGMTAATGLPHGLADAIHSIGKRLNLGQHICRPVIAAIEAGDGPAPRRTVMPQEPGAVMALLSFYTAIVPQATAQNFAPALALDARRSIPFDLTGFLTKWFRGHDEDKLADFYESRKFPELFAGFPSLGARVPRLRPEFVRSFSWTHEVLPELELITIGQQRVCDTCGVEIRRGEAYKFERPSDRLNELTQLAFLCPACHERPGTRVHRVRAKFEHLDEGPSMQTLYFWKDGNDKLHREPKFVRTPLNPDAFDFPRANEDIDGLAEDENFTDIQMLVLAADMLHREAIPGFIKRLRRFSIVPTSPRDLVAKMHQYGINARYLGRIAVEVGVAYLIDLAFQAIYIRTAKRLLRQDLPTVRVQEHTRLFTYFLNVLLLHAEFPASEKLWMRLVETSKRSFGVKLLPKCTRNANIRQLTLEFAAAVGAVLSPDLPWQELGPERLFSATDVLRIEPVVSSPKLPSILRVTEVVTERCKAEMSEENCKCWHTPDTTRASWVNPQLQAALEVSDAVFGASSAEAARVKVLLGLREKALHETRGHPANSEWNHSAKIPPSEASKAALRYFLEASISLEFHAHQDHADMLELTQTYFSVAALVQPPTECAEIQRARFVALINKAVRFSRFALAPMHPLLAHHLHIASRACLEVGKPFAALQNARDAFLIRHNTFGPKHALTLESFRLCAAAEKAANTSLQGFPLDAFLSKICAKP